MKSKIEEFKKCKESKNGTFCKNCSSKIACRLILAGSSEIGKNGTSNGNF